MYCSKCGCAVNEGDVFCHKCGARIQESIVEENSMIKNSYEKGLDHSALSIYLNDVLSLECIKRKYDSELNAISKKLTSMKNWYVYSSEKLFEDYTVHLAYNGEKYFIVFHEGRLEVYLYSILYEKGWRWREIDKIIEGRLKNLLDVWEQCADSILKRKKRETLARDNFLKIYEKFKETAPANYDNHLKEIKRIVDTEMGIRQELRQLNDLLDKTYNINIIPSQFRHDIYAVYYLYDFVNTSKLSLATALLHFDLNEIKNKLDKIINQQQEIIIQQAIMAAQNQDIIEQNQQQLRKLANIERNTADAATYSAIAASNAEACAWIGLANYLKK